MKLIFILTVVLVLLALSSCEYNNQEVYERNLNQNVANPDLDITNFDLSEDEDTIVLLYNRVYFNFKCSNKIKWVKFYLNNSLLGTVESDSGYFDMYYEFLYVGTHRLKIELLASSGTGSIADSLGAEGYLYSTKEWVVKVNDTYYSNVTSTSSDGFLKLRWPKPYWDIAEFIVYRGNTEIGRTTAYEFVDKGYVGEGAIYRVMYKNSYDDFLSTYGYVELPNEINFEFTYNTYNEYAIDWSNYKYYAAIDSIIVFGNDGSYEPYEFQRTNDFNQKNFPIPTSYFGQLREYRMALTPKYSNPQYDPTKSSNFQFVSPRKEFMVGYPSPIFNDFNRINNSEFLYHTSLYDYEHISRNDSLFRYSITENRILERYRYNPPNYTWSGDHYSNPTTSPDGFSYVAVVGLSKTAIYGSTKNLKDYSIFDISNLTSIDRRMPISNTGIGLIISYNHKHLFDFKSGKLLGTLNDGTSYSNYNISPDGNYFFLNSGGHIDFYSFLNNTITLERLVSPNESVGYNYFNFMANDADKAVSWSNSSKLFAIIKFTDWSVVKSFNVDEDEILDIDYTTNRILSFSPNLLVVRSLDDGTILYSIPVGFHYIYLNHCYLIGNSIIQERGSRYFLN